MKKKSFLIADFGASNGRVLQADFNGDRFQLHEVHRFVNRPVSAGGTLYWDFLRLFDDLKTGIGRAFHDSPHEIVSLAVDTWGCDFGLLDANGGLLSNPVHYRDGRRHRVIEKLFAKVPAAELFAVSGFIQASIMSVYQLFAMRIDKDPVLDTAETLLFMPDLFAYLLTGEKYNEATIAVSSLLYNVSSRSWDTEMIRRLTLPEHIFQPVLNPADTIGTISSNVCEETGAKAIPVIAPASHDTASAVAGIPLIRQDGTWGFISLGTWAVFGTSVQDPVMDFSVLKAGYGNEFTLGGKNFFARNITALWIIQECKKYWDAEDGRKNSWEDIITAAESSKPLAFFIDVDDPDFAAVQADMPNRIRAYCTKTKQPVPEERGEISRCVFESIVLKFKQCFYETKQYTGKPIDRIHMLGGGSKNRFLCRSTADALGVPVYAGPVEATAMGNLLAQLTGTGTISSLEEGHELIRRSCEMETYGPGEQNAWEEAYQKYIKITGGTV